MRARAHRIQDMRSACCFVVGLIFCVFETQAQVFISSSSEISFFSATPVEDIKAINTKSSSLLNTNDRHLVFQIPVKAFQFEKDLMKEHFNENYLESDKYPKASFNGNINEKVDLSKDGTYEVTALGKLLIHGVEKERTFKGVITRNGDQITVKGEFQVALADHKIKIPKVVIAHIAEVIDVKVAATYKPYVKKK